MGKKNRESNRTIRSSTVTHQQDEIFEYLTKTFNRKDGPIQVEILLFLRQCTTISSTNRLGYV